MNYKFPIPISPFWLMSTRISLNRSLWQCALATFMQMSLKRGRLDSWTWLPVEYRRRYSSYWSHWNWTLCCVLDFDGASVMSGSHGRVHVILKRTFPNTIYVHCNSHRLNLVLCMVASASGHISTFFKTFCSTLCTSSLLEHIDTHLHGNSERDAPGATMDGAWGPHRHPLELQSRFSKQSANTARYNSGNASSVLREKRRDKIWSRFTVAPNSDKKVSVPVGDITEFATSGL